MALLWTLWIKRGAWYYDYLGSYHCTVERHRVNIIDTPGHVDFTVEVERSLRVLDSAVTLLDAKERCRASDRNRLAPSRYYGVPRIAYINKMDITGADFFKQLKR